MNGKTTKFRWFMWEGVGSSSWFMWTVSTFLSYWGLTHLAPNLPGWVRLIALGFSIVINFVEFMIGQKGWGELWHPKTFGDVVLRLFGLACYAYDILTNVLGFAVILHTGLNVPEVANALGITEKAVTITFDVLAFIFGFSFAAGPEPVYIEYLLNKFPYPGIHPITALWSKLNRSYVPRYQQKQKAPQATYQYNQSKQGNVPNSEMLKTLREKYPNHFQQGK